MPLGFRARFALCDVWARSHHYEQQEPLTSTASNENESLNRDLQTVINHVGEGRKTCRIRSGRRTHLELPQTPVNCSRR